MMKSPSSWLIAASIAVLAFPISLHAVAAEEKTAQCQISCVSPFPTDAEGDRVIAVVKNITKALADRKFDDMLTYMDEQCTTYDGNTKRTVVGRDAIVADVKLKIAAEEAKSNAPIVSYEIDRPFAQVNGDTAVVCFVLVKDVGGAHPTKYAEHCTDVFVKRGQDWKKLNFRSDTWKRCK
ncbi:MAG TPA: nuclear transport factor 2 family protein [Trichormus sp.]|jgi:hypothetical protein